MKNDKIFRFLCNKGFRGSINDRGGIQYLLEAFLGEFSDKDNVMLVLKINPAYGAPDMNKVMNEFRQKFDKDKTFAPIQINTTNIPYKNLPALYQGADCYVCATRAESFGLDTAEAMACGLPIITTNYGGQIEHIGDYNGMIDYKLEPVKGDVMYENISWATPDIKSLRKLMREAYENSDWVKEIGEHNRKFIQDFTWDKSAEKALEFLKK